VHKCVCSTTRRTRVVLVPATAPDPLDFLREHPGFDASLVAMEFDEQFPPLSRSAATAMVAVDVIGRVRAQAKNPEGPRDGFEESERLAMWFRYHTSPESVRKKIAPRLDGMPLLPFHSSGCNSSVPVRNYYTRAGRGLLLLTFCTSLVCMWNSHAN
jgi:hypothetical protein